MLLRLTALSLILCFSVAGLASTPKPVPTVITHAAKLSDLSDILSYPARIESKVNSRLYSESDGVVTKIIAPLGSQVHRGSKIVIVKHTDPVYQYAPMVLTSSVDGVVSQVDITEGSAITKGQLIAAVTDPKQIRVVIELAASDLFVFKKGLKGDLTLGGQDSEVFPIEVIGLSPVIDPATGTATCDLELTKSHTGTIPPGVLGQATFKINPRQAFVFPDNAIVYRGNNTFVRIVQNGVAKRVPVTLGKKERGQVEILKGLKEGDVVIERASSFVGEGEKVQIQSEGQGESAKD